MAKIIGNTTATTLMAEQNYSPTSNKPQSGKAVAQAVERLNDKAFDYGFKYIYDERELDEVYDDFTEDGLYKIYYAPSSDDMPTRNIMLSVTSSLFYLEDYNGTEIYQTKYDDGMIEKRTRNVYGEWSKWEKISVSLSDLNKKVDKVSGKGLSTNDFTDALKSKLESIPEGGSGTNVIVDDKLSLSSTNPVQNKVITDALNKKADKGNAFDNSFVIEDEFSSVEEMLNSIKHNNEYFSYGINKFEYRISGYPSQVGIMYVGLVTRGEFNEIHATFFAQDNTVWETESWEDMAMFYDWTKISTDGGADITIDDKLSLQSANPVQNKVITAELNEKVGKCTQNENILDNVELFDEYVLQDNGKVTSNASYITTDYIVIPAGESLSLNGSYRMYAVYDANQKHIYSEYKDTEGSNFIYTNSTDADKYIRISFRKAYFNASPVMLTRTTTPQMYSEPKMVIESDVYFNDVQNEQLGCYVKKEPFDLLKSIRLFDGCLISSKRGTIGNTNTFYTTDYIKVEKGNSLAFTGMFSRFLAYDESLQPMEDTYNAADRSDFVYTAPTDATHYVRVSVRTTTPNNKTMITRTSTVQPYTDTESVYLEQNVLLNKQQIEQVMGETLYDYKNMLTGKKWVACGDSFTENGYTAEDGEHKFTEGLYAGKNMVYPFFIGRRCGIDVTNYAAGGMTLAHVEGYNNCFATSKYTTIPADTDYITLYFGINDNHQSVPIGTADDTDNTTFCGAWNIVLEYLITNHPLAHIGIIVSNGTSSAFVEATKQMAIKWGIPYLDLATDNQTPLVLRTNKTDVCTTAKNLRLQTFRVSDTNSHPNNACHEYESYCIENWLMSL